MKKINKIIFVLPSLVAGGAERVMSFIAQNIDSKKFKVTLLIIGFEKDSAYQINGIDVIYLNKSRVLYSIFPLLKFLVINKPKIVISAIGHLNTVMAYLSIFFPKIKFVSREVNILSILASYQLKKVRFSSFFNFFSKRRFYFFDKIICQSNDMLRDIKENNNIPEKKLRVINNPVTDDFKLKSENEKKRDVVQFITVARLKRQKGHERIIYALSKINFPYQYTIVGDGPEQDNLFKLIKTLGIKDKIIHIPYTNDVSKYLSKSDLFLQGAFIEGFPNCLLESCAVGTPIVAFKAPGGIDEIILDGVNGFISEDEEEFVNNILKSIKNHKWDIKEVSNSVIRKFNKEKIIQQYEELFLNILKE